MNNKIRLPYDVNFRETILLMTVFYVLLFPMHEIKATTVDITYAVMQFLVYGSLLFQTARSVTKDSLLFLWDKVIFFVSLLMEGGLMAARPFVEQLPDVLSWIALVWACAMMIAGIALIGIYPTLEKKGKWKSSLPAEEAGGIAFCNYMTMAVSLLAISHVIF